MEETEVAGRLATVESRCKSNSHRLEALEKQTEAVNHLATSVAVMAEKVENTGDKVDGLCNDVKELKSEPGRRWKLLVEKIISLLAAAAIGYILARLGLG